MIDDLNPRSVMVRRFGYYAVGLAIGLVALGFIQMGRRAQLASQAERAAMEAEALAVRAREEAKARGLPQPPGPSSPAVPPQAPPVVPKP